MSRRKLTLDKFSMMWYNFGVGSHKKIMQDVPGNRRFSDFAGTNSKAREGGRGWRHGRQSGLYGFSDERGGSSRLDVRVATKPAAMDADAVKRIRARLDERLAIEQSV